MAVAMLLCILWSGCAGTPRAVPVSAPLSQPDWLRLTPGTVVQTPDGPYSPTQPEVWMSERKYRELTQENRDLVEALRKAEAERHMSF